MICTFGEVCECFLEGLSGVLDAGIGLGEMGEGTGILRNIVNCFGNLSSRGLLFIVLLLTLSHAKHSSAEML